MIPVPMVEAAAVTAAPSSVLAAIASATVCDGDSVVLRFGVAGTGLDSVTPALRPAAGPVELPVLGLLAGTAYRLLVVAFRGDASASSDTLAITTGRLPDDLPGHLAGGPAPSPGYVLFSTPQYGIVLDNAGRVVWYVRFPDGPSLNFQAQPNGRNVARPGTPDPGDVEPLVEFDILGRVTRTGEVVWRMGGLRDQFAFPAAGAPFLRQHGLRVTPEGGIAVLDNFGEVEGSRGERWALDSGARTASLTRAYSPMPATRANLGGATQLLPGGGVLVAYGDGGRLEEYDAAGARVWQVEGDAGYVFRAQRIRSLYRPEEGLTR